MRLVALFGCLFLASCLFGSVTNHFDQYYSHQAPQKYPPVKSVVYVHTFADADTVYQHLFSDFLIIGRLDFNDSSFGRYVYVEYAKKVGADIVIASTTNKTTENWQETWKFPTTKTTKFSGSNTSGNIFSGTITTDETETVKLNKSRTRFDHKALFLKKISSETKAPWEYKKSDYTPIADKSDFDGVWQNIEYDLEIITVNDEVIAFIGQLTEFNINKNNNNDPKMRYAPGDIKFRFNRNTGIGIAFDIKKWPYPARFRVNKFQHLELSYNGKIRASFKKVAR